VLFHYGQALKVNQKYTEARQVWERLAAQTEIEPLREHTERQIEAIDKLNALREKPSYYRVRNLEVLNTPAAEYAPFHLNDELYFTSSRGSGRVYEATGTPFTKIFKITSRGAIVDLATLAPLPDVINTENVNNGCITFTPDGRTMVFAKGNSGKRRGASDVDLYMSRFRNGEWSEPVPLNINDPNAWDSSPAFSQDGRTLYFASNRQGRGRNMRGYGGIDIYAAQMDSRGRFSRVRNLGPEINTPGNELFPYVADDAKFYFASDGHPNP
jgi:peptidoglycan-associated lipoprotein